MDKIEYIKGDLVMIKAEPGNFRNGVVCKFDKYKFDKYNGDQVLLNKANSLVDFLVKSDQIAPVPLTSEILDKNDFGAKQIGLHEFLLYNEDNDMYLEWSDLDNRYTYNDFCRSKNFITIKYVHELQHLLFGLGLNHEMDI